MDTVNMSGLNGSFLGVDELQILKNHVKLNKLINGYIKRDYLSYL